MYIVIWAFALAAAIAALWQARTFYVAMLAAPVGTPKMVEIAGYVREGANAYLKQQYRVVVIIFAIIFLLLLAASFGMEVVSRFVPFAFLISGFLSGLAGWLGMKTATAASNRTAAGAQDSLNAGLQVAFRSGAVMGLVVVGLALLDITIWFAVLYWGFGLDLSHLSVTMVCFGMGASGQALFARVGGGIFTKAADVGADLVGKVEKSIPEDDARNPATIADNVGDNVGDVAGMGADLYESYYGAILASAALGVAAFGSPAVLKNAGIDPTPANIVTYQLAGMFLPIGIAAVGILLSILGVYSVRTSGEASQRNLLKALARGINLSTVLVVVAVFLLTMLLLPMTYWLVSLSVCVGLLAGWLIGWWTEYSTSDEYRPTRNLAAQAATGPATVIIAGVAEGMLSTWVPVLVVSFGTLLAFGLASNWNFESIELFTMGLYGIGVAAVGMLSTLGITLATDAYGPIADNAGGNAQMAELEPVVRERTDALDSLGNTTAATGKGFAIGSAALTTLALLAAYIEEVKVGFDHWAKSVVAADAKPGIYKVSREFLVEVDDKGARHGWMVFTSRVPLAPWRSIDVSKGPVEVTSHAAAVRLESSTLADETGRIARLAVAGDEHRLDIIRHDAMTLRDFMRYYDCSLMNPKVLVGVFLGSMITFVFCALTIKAVGRAANQMVEEVRRQFREKPGIMQGTDKPDYASPVQISTKAAQKEMIFPALLGLFMPVIVGLLLGVGGVLGLLVGALTTGFCVAVFMANSGGAWDNAKKYIEAGAQGGKGTEAHKAAVVGDTVGDPFKDTSGPSLNILIKLMSMVSVVVAGLVVRYSLQAMGIF